MLREKCFSFFDEEKVGISYTEIVLKIVIVTDFWLSPYGLVGFQTWICKLSISMKNNEMRFKYTCSLRQFDYMWGKLNSVG